MGTCLDEVPLLALPEDAEFLIQLLNRVDDLCTTMGKLAPINERLSPDKLKNMLKVLLNIINLDFCHVEI